MIQLDDNLSPDTLLQRSVTFYELMDLLTFEQLSLMGGHVPDSQGTQAAHARLGWQVWDVVDTTQEECSGTAPEQDIDGTGILLRTSAAALNRAVLPGTGIRLALRRTAATRQADLHATQQAWLTAEAATNDASMAGILRLSVDLSTLLQSVILSYDTSERQLALVTQLVQRRVWVPVERASAGAAFGPLAAAHPFYTDSATQRRISSP